MPHHHRTPRKWLGVLSPLLINLAHLLCVGAEGAAVARERFSEFYDVRLRALCNTVSGVIESIRRSRLQTAAACFIPALLLASLWLHPSLLVSVDGTPIGYVSHAEDLYSVTAAIETRSSELLGRDYKLAADVSLTPSLSTEHSILPSKLVESAVAEAVDGLDTVSVVSVGNQTIGVTASQEDAQEALDSIKARYVTGEGDSADFVQDVSVSSVIADAAAAQSTGALEQALEATDENGNPILSVSVTRRISYHEAIPYDTVTRTNANLAQNKKQVVQSGAKGDISVEASVTLVNGEETTRQILSRTVLSEATDEIIEVGTKNVGIGTGKLRRPLSGYSISSTFKYRNGRLHTGYDLACSVGTSVYAADNGRVVFSGYDSSGYGKYIIVDHRNGLQTLYAHCSSLLVKKGDIVAKGDKIAKSGNTGRSTGPHLHFEVRKDGTPVNPSKYVSF